MKNTIYYLPGHGGQLATGLGEALTSRGLDVAGRETLGEFLNLAFSEQVALVAEDLKTHFWDRDALVIANSFGGYLFLHAQASLPPYPGRVLILSPIVGQFSSRSIGKSFLPPCSKKLRRLAEDGAFPTPRDAHIHVGSEDWQSVPENVQEFGRMTGISVTVVEKAGHRLPREYISQILDDWLVPGVA